MDEKTYNARKERLGAISIEIAKLDSKLAKASDQDMHDIAKELVKLAGEKDILVATLAAMRNQEREDQEAASQRQREQEAARKEKLFAEIKSRIEGGKVLCECGSRLKLVGDGPEFLTNGWRTQDTRGANFRKWRVNLVCESRPCRARLSIYPDQTESSRRQRSRKKTESLTQGYLPSG